MDLILLLQIVISLNSPFEILIAQVIILLLKMIKRRLANKQGLVFLKRRTPNIKLDSIQQRFSVSKNTKHSTSSIDSYFDKYYISPRLRYRSKMENPKQNPQNYNDQTFIYRNLHNKNFWNWQHPLTRQVNRSLDSNFSSKINIEALEGFKRYVDQKQERRLPQIIKQVLKK